MEIVNLSQNDDMTAVARKCNINFKRLSWSLRQTMDKLLTQLPSTLPPTGSYVMQTSEPDYSGTTWQQVDSITTDNNVTIPLWQRTS